MKIVKCIVGIGCVWIAMKWYAQTGQLTNNLWTALHVYTSMDKLPQKDVELMNNGSFVNVIDKPTFCRIEGLEFQNGPMARHVLTRLIPDATDLSCGIVGIAFRVDKRSLTFDSFYVRAASVDHKTPIRNKHTLYYFSLPDYKFDRLKKGTIRTHESYAIRTMK